MRSLQDVVMQGLSNTVYTDTEYLEQVVASDEEILEEIREKLKLRR